VKMDRWSENEKYIVMIGGMNHSSSVVGVKPGYQAFLEFKKVMGALREMSKSESNYFYDGHTYSRVITSSRAQQVLMKIERCEWDDDIRTVAKQIKAVGMLSPVR
jgi:hypothetical protein